MPLTITLTPGHVWVAGELLTEDKLNDTANPTIELEGTISAASLADNSVTLAKLVVGILSADTAGRSRMADGYLTLAKIDTGIFTADAAGRAKFANDFVTQDLIADAAVGTAQIIDANVTLAKLSAGIIASATSKTTPTTSDSLLIADAAASNATKKITILALQTLLTPTKFTSGEAVISSTGTVLNEAHSLGAIPAKVRAVLVCKAGEAGYTAGDEIDISGVTDHTNYRAFSFGASATHVFAVRWDHSSSTDVLHKTTGQETTITASSWRFKIYAWL